MSHFFGLVVFLESKRSSESLESLIDFLAYCCKNYGSQTKKW